MDPGEIQKWDWLGNLDGEQAQVYLQDTGEGPKTYARIFEPWLDNAKIREELSFFGHGMSKDEGRWSKDRDQRRLKKGIGSGAEACKALATGKNEGVFWGERRLVEEVDQDLNPFAYALGLFGKELSELCGLDVDVIKQYVDETNIDEFIESYFECVETPQEGDLVVYESSEDPTHQKTHAGVFHTRNSRSGEKAGSVESKWGGIGRNAEVFQHHVFYVPEEYGNVAKFYRLRKDKPTLKHRVLTSEDLKERESKVISEKPRKIALIIEASHDYNNAFLHNRGFYHYDIQALKDAGYEIQHRVVNTTEEIERLGQEFPDNSIGFCWIRGHGTPQGITFGKDPEKGKLTSEQVETIFSWLPQKLQSEGHILLDSCSTGALSESYYKSRQSKKASRTIEAVENNIQFNFGKLTKNLPNVKIIAPRVDSEIAYFFYDKEKNEFVFDMQTREQFWSGEWSGFFPIAVELGPKTKKLLLDLAPASEDEQALSAYRMALMESLVVQDRKQTMGLLCRGDFPNFLLYEERAGNLLSAVLSCIAQPEIYPIQVLDFLYDEMHVDLNEHSDFMFSSPLFLAISERRNELVKWLLDHGVDPNTEIDSTTALAYAKKQGNQEVVYLLIQAMRAQHKPQIERVAVAVEKPFRPNLG